MDIIKVLSFCFSEFKKPGALRGSETIGNSVQFKSKLS